MEMWSSSPVQGNQWIGEGTPPDRSRQTVLSRFHLWELGPAVGPRGAWGWGKGGPGFLPEAGWKPAALLGAWRQQRWGWAERRAGGSPGGSSRRPVQPRLHGVPSLPGLEALWSEGVWVESCNYPAERDLRPQYTPSVFALIRAISGRGISQPAHGGSR